MSRNQFVGVMAVSFTVLFLVLGVRVCHDTAVEPKDAVCMKACYPNPVDRVYGKQCFCKADIVIREMPNEEVPGNR